MMFVLFFFHEMRFIFIKFPIEVASMQVAENSRLFFALFVTERRENCLHQGMKST